MSKKIKLRFDDVFRKANHSIDEYHNSLRKLELAVKQREPKTDPLFRDKSKQSLDFMKNSITNLQFIQMKKEHLFFEKKLIHQLYSPTNYLFRPTNPLTNAKNIILYKIMFSKGHYQIYIEEAEPAAPWISTTLHFPHRTSQN